MAQTLCDPAYFFLPHLVPLSFTLHPVSHWSLFSCSNLYSLTASGLLHILPLYLECSYSSSPPCALYQSWYPHPFSSLRSWGRTPLPLHSALVVLFLNLVLTLHSPWHNLQVFGLLFYSFTFVSASHNYIIMSFRIGTMCNFSWHTHHWVQFTDSVLTKCLLNKWMSHSVVTVLNITPFLRSLYSWLRDGLRVWLSSLCNLHPPLPLPPPPLFFLRLLVMLISLTTLIERAGVIIWCLIDPTWDLFRLGF